MSGKLATAFIDAFSLFAYCRHSFSEQKNSFYIDFLYLAFFFNEYRESTLTVTQTLSTCMVIPLALRLLGSLTLSLPPYRHPLERCSRTLRGDSEGWCTVRRWARQVILDIIRSPLWPWHKTALLWATYLGKPVSSSVKVWPSAGSLYVSLDTRKHDSFCLLVCYEENLNMISILTYCQFLIGCKKKPWMRRYFPGSYLSFSTLPPFDWTFCRSRVGLQNDSWT